MNSIGNIRIGRLSARTPDRKYTSKLHNLVQALDSPQANAHEPERYRLILHPGSLPATREALQERGCKVSPLLGTSNFTGYAGASQALHFHFRLPGIHDRSRGFVSESSRDDLVPENRFMSITHNRIYLLQDDFDSAYALPMPALGIRTYLGFTPKELLWLNDKNRRPDPVNFRDWVYQKYLTDIRAIRAWLLTHGETATLREFFAEVNGIIRTYEAEFPEDVRPHQSIEDYHARFFAYDDPSSILESQMDRFERIIRDNRSLRELEILYEQTKGNVRWVEGPYRSFAGEPLRRVTPGLGGDDEDL